MGKFLSILFSFLLLALISLYIVFYHGNLLIQALITSHTHLKTTVEKLSLQKQEFALQGLEIANPQRAKSPTALRVKTISIQSPYGNYLKNPIVIQKIHLDQIYIDIELYNRNRTEGNWHTLIQTLKKSSKEKPATSSNRTIEVDTLLLTNIHIDLTLQDGKTESLSPIKELEFHNLSSEGGFAIQQIAQAIIQKMMQEVFLKKGLKSLFQAPENLLRGVFPPLFGSASQEETKLTDVNAL